LDGTLLNKDAKITPFTAKIINKLIGEGLVFTYASARGLIMASRTTEGINFIYPAVHHNGVCVQNPKTGEYFRKCILDKDIMLKTIAKMRDNGLFPLVYAFIDERERYSWILGKETEEIKIFLKSRVNDKRKRPVNDYGELLGGDIHGILFLGKSSEELQKILDIDVHAWDEGGKIDLLKAGDKINVPEYLFEKIEDAAIGAQISKLNKDNL